MRARLNLRELFANFKEDPAHPEVGFSTFASLRPSWCVLAGPKGTHAVCVCSYHQNAKLMIAAMSDFHIVGLEDFMAKTVCSLASELCMMRKCKECPGLGGIMQDAQIKEIFCDIEEVTYKLWISTDHTSLVTISEAGDDFVEHLADKLVELTRHHYIAKAQSTYMKALKENIRPSEAVVQGDFSENFSFVIQDEAQGYRWEHSQATVHPFVVYYRNQNSETTSRCSYCVISDSKDHSTASVYAFQKALLKELRAKLPLLKKIHYFTDGCAGQYKNKFNFINLCHHSSDFNIDAEWNFFATSHGKGPCDGIGASVKRCTAKASLQRPILAQITTAKDMFEYCRSEINFPNIKMLFVSDEEIRISKQSLQERFALAVTIKGTQRLHRLKPVSKTHLEVYDTSSNNPLRTVSITKDASGQPGAEEVVYHVGDFVACMLFDMVWLGVKDEISAEFGDCHVKLLHPSGISDEPYHWPAQEDRSWFFREDILCGVQFGLDAVTGEHQLPH